MPEVELGQGTIHFEEAGPAAGPPVVFVHGVLAGGSLWADLLRPLADAGMRPIAPDWPIGAHRHPVDGLVTVSTLADLVDELCEALGLSDVTLVGNDSGGAVCQHVVDRHPARVARLVLTNCDAFEIYPPAFFKPLIVLCRSDPGLRAALGVLGSAPGRRLVSASLARTHHPDRVAGWVERLRRNGALRRTVLTFMRGVDVGDSLAVGARLRRFPGPALVAWGESDPHFRPALGRRLAAAFADGHYVGIPGSRCFVPFDAPDRLAELIVEFAAEGGVDPGRRGVTLTS